MKIITITLVLSIFFSCNTHISNDHNKIQKDSINIETKYVSAKSGLIYRKKPKGKILGKFEYGEKLEIIEHANFLDSVKDEKEVLKNEWLGVKINNDTVYVFGGYLSVKKPIFELKKEQDPYKILLPSTCRNWKNENPVDDLNKQWLALYKNNSKYYINTADYKIRKGYDECTGDSTKTIITENKTLLFIKNSKIKSGEIYYYKINKNKIWPGEKTSYKYNNIEYNIRAEGEFTDPKIALLEKDSEFYAEVKNYKLYISTNSGNESLFLEEKSFDDTFVKILFVGDIDSDGRLDFIFEANRDYEEERVILFLSSEATKREIIKKVGEIAVQFAC